MDANWLEIITNLFVIGSVIGSPIAYFWKRKIDKNAIRDNAGRSILEEINDIQQDLTRDGEIKPISHTYDGDEKIEFYPVYVSYTGFQSIVHSGHYALFSKGLQKKLSDVYLRIELNNKTMDLIQELFVFSKQHGIKLGTTQYYDLMIDAWMQLTKIQIEILEYTHILKNQLKEEIKID